MEVQDPRKMIVFVKYLFGDEGANLRDHCRDEWLKSFDPPWVDNCVAGVVAWGAEADRLLEKQERLVYLATKPPNAAGGLYESTDEEETEYELEDEDSENGTLRKKKKKKSGPRLTNATVPEPFRFHPSRPKPLPPPEPKREPIKPRPAPVVRAGPTAEQIELERAKRRNRAEAEARLEEAQKLQFKLRASERPTNVEKVRAEVEAERLEAERVSLEKSRGGLPVPPGVPLPMPEYPKKVEVKMTAAATLREDATYEKRRREEARRIADFEMNLRDGAEFENWQARMRDEDKARELRRIEETKKEMEAAFEKALEARREALEKNALKAERAKALTKSLEAKATKARAMDRERRSAMREKVVEEKQRVELAKAELGERRKAAADSRVAEKRAAELRLAEERARDRRRKADLVAQIRAFEAAQRDSGECRGGGGAANTRRAVAELSLAGGLGLLEDMSVAELRIRLKRAKELAAEDRERASARIKEQRVAREELLKRAEGGIARARGYAAELGRDRRDATAEDKRRLEEARRRKLLEERTIVERKRAEKMKLREDAEAKEKERLRVEAWARDARGEARRRSRLERDVAAGYEREALRREDEAEAASRFAVRTRRVEARARREGKRAEKREKTRYELEYERRLRDAGAADATMRREELEEKQRRVASEKAREESVRRRFAIESREGTKIGPVKAGVGRGSLLRAGLVSPVASPMGKKEARERALATLSDGDDERRGGDAAAAGTGEYSRGVGSFAALGAATLKREEGALGRETMLDAAGGTGGVARSLQTSLQ